MGKMGFAVIGCGRMGRRRIRTIMEHPNAILIAVADNDERMTKEMAKEYGCEYYHDFCGVIERNDVDHVIISTPNKFHAPIAIASLNKKKNVICEKPLARNPEEAILMVKAALDNGVFLKTASNLRFFPSVLKAKNLLDEGRIGEILFLRGWIGHSGWNLKDSWFSDPEMAGGGTFLDNGCHILDLSRWFLGEFHECIGYAEKLFWPVSPLEDNAFGIFKTLDGKLAFIQSSWMDWHGYMYMEIYGSEGYICIDNRAEACKTTLGRRDGFKQIFDYSSMPHVSYRLEMEDYIRSIKNGEQPLPSGYDGLRAVQMAYGVYESSKTGRTVEIYNEDLKKLLPKS